MTGRPENHRYPTELWLGINDIPYDKLLMRPERDMRADVIIKQAIFDTHIRDNYRVTGVWDDRPELVAMWSAAGLTVTAVVDPDLDPTLVNGRAIVAEAVARRFARDNPGAVPDRGAPGHDR